MTMRHGDGFAAGVRIWVLCDTAKDDTDIMFCQLALVQPTYKQSSRKSWRCMLAHLMLIIASGTLHVKLIVYSMLICCI